MRFFLMLVFLCEWFTASLPAEEIDDPLSPRSFDFSGKSFLLEVASDLWQYNIEYGYSSKKLNHRLSVTHPECTLYTFPFKSSIYFRIQSEDKRGAKSSFNEVTALEAK